jgi:D-alanyl-D-alanine-carboxypeptidase/D-alanyl-D-alanine-endopeptidase
MQRAHLAGILCSLTLFAAIVAPVYGLDLHSQIDSLAQPLVDNGDVVGMVVGIIRDRETQVLAYGETTKGSGKAPNATTVYEIGSVTKAFTGVLLADAVLAGSVKLDDPVQKYLPSSVKMPVADGEPITLEDLATHTSGLPRLPDNLAPQDALNPYAAFAVKDMYEFLNGHKLRRPPGGFEYSNFGMGLLGHVLALEAGQTYEDLVVERIAKPLGMNDTDITLSASQRARLAAPYDAMRKPNKNWDIPTLAGAGAIRSTVNDMLKFLQANLAEDDTALTKAMKFARVKRHDIPGGLAIGLGWHLARDGITWWHNGMTGGYSSWMSVVPSKKVGVVVLSNTATLKTTELGEQVTRVTCGIPVKLPAERKEVPVDARVLESYVGKYAFIPEFVLTVTVEDGKLMAQATGQQKLQVFAESPTKFFYKVVDAQITFEKDSSGKVTQLVLHQHGQDMPAKRLD